MKGNGDLQVSGATHDSRLVEPGCLFAALLGANVDGGAFARQAVEAGAAAILCGEELSVRVPQIVVPDPRGALGKAAAAAYGNPTGSLSLAGITGTNGKTTVTYILEAALAAAGARAGVMGTVEYRFGGRKWKADHTTPEAPVIQAVAREMADAGASHLVMEVSSHGLSLGRLGGCEFDVVAFTNLTQDHLDFHADMEEYAAAKMKLFTEVIADRPDARAVVNADDPFGRTIVGACPRPTLSISCDPGSSADIRPRGEPTYGIDGIRTMIETPAGPLELDSPMLGSHNLNNLLVALGVCFQLGVAPEAAAKGVSALRSVPGRLERVSCDLGFTVLVDYAHTPDALSRALSALRPLTKGRLMCVFGCGGDRDTKKRPLMGAAVGGGADVAVVTSDNPRTEDPGAIIDMILPGVESGPMVRVGTEALSSTAAVYTVEPDRSSAIALAIRSAGEGDTVLIAGKGHEDYQILGKAKIHFDDREHAAEAISRSREAGR